MAGILPIDIAQAAGAFSVSMLQIRNIQSMSIEKFSQAVTNLENVSDLNVNGTNVPTNTPLANSALSYLALGTGYRGLYTMCDFFGAMTNIHYPHSSITAQISRLQTQKLFNIYAELLLAVSWQNASVSVQYSTETVETSPGNFETRYRVTGVTVSGSGGGYGRGTAPPPIITISNGAGASVTTKITDIRFGRVGIATVTPSSGYSLTPPSVTIQSPPTALLPVQADGKKAQNGTNSPPGTSGWPTMDGVVQGYINQANTEITAIYNNNTTAGNALINTYNIFGTYLKKEQDARALALPNLEDLTSITHDIVTFVNGSVPFGLDTTTFGASNVLNQIHNPAYLGGRSLVGGLREARNQARLGLAGGALDNDVNGTTVSPSLSSQSTRTNGKPLVDSITGINSSGFLTINSDGTASGPGGTQININPADIPPGYVIGPGINLNTINPTIDNLIIPEGASNGYGEPPFDNYNLSKPIEGSDVSIELIDVPLYTGDSNISGSFAGSTESSLIPDRLSILVVPSANSVLTQSEAISEVIKCNCDCWDDL